MQIKAIHVSDVSAADVDTRVLAGVFMIAGMPCDEDLVIEGGYAMAGISFKPGVVVDRAVVEGLLKRNAPRWSGRDFVLTGHNDQQLVLNV